MTKDNRSNDGNETPIPRSRMKRMIGLLSLLVIIGLSSAKPLSMQYQLWQARKCLHDRDPAVEHHLQQAISLYPEHPEAHFLLARSFRRNGRLELMKKHLQQAWDSGFDVERLKREQWLALAQQGDLRKVRTQIPELLKNPGDDGAEISEAIANGMFITYQFDLASDLIGAWARDYPDDPQPHLFLGTLHEHRSSWNEAVDEFRQALELAPQRTDIRIKLATALTELHQYDTAVDEYRQSLQQRPQDVNAIVGLSKCLIATGKIAQALEQLKRAISIDSKHFGANLAIGQLELNEGHPDKAVAPLQVAVDSRPHSVPARFALANALQGTGQPTDAKEHFDRIKQQNEGQSELRNLLMELEREPDRVDLRFKVGTLLLEFGNPKEGAGWLQSVLQFEPQHTEAHQALANYYSGQGLQEPAEHHRRLSE